MQRIKLKRRSLLLVLGVTSASFLTQWDGRDTFLAIVGKGADRPFKPPVQAKLNSALSQVMSANKIPGVVLGL